MTHKVEALSYFKKDLKRKHPLSEISFLKILRKIEREKVIQFSNLKKGGTLIDVGCGRGYYSLQGMKAGMKVTAIDIFPELIRKLTGKVNTTLVGDVETLTLSKTFNRVICAGVLDFVLNPEKALSNLFRLTSPKGRLILLVPRTGIGGQIYRLEKNLSGFDVNLFSLDWLTLIAQKNSMRLVDVDYPLPHNLVASFENK